MASVPVAAATAVVIGLLFAGTIGVDGVFLVWAALSLMDLPSAVLWPGIALTGLGLAFLTLKLAVAAWRVERLPVTAVET